MKKFLIKIIAYCVIIFSAGYLVQYFVDAGLQKYNSKNFGEWNEIFSGKINSDIIILGSSRALAQMDPKVITNYTGLSCYNLGISGGRFLMQKAKWDSYLAHNKPPKILIQNVDLITLIKEDYIFGKQQYLPYLSRKTIYSNLELVDGNIWLEKSIPLYKYRGFRKLIILGLKSYFGLIPHQKSILKRGFAGINKGWNKDFAKFKARHKYVRYPENELKFGFNYLENLCKQCKSDGIKLILVHAPMYSKLLHIIPQKHYIDSVFSSIAKKYNMQYWDFTGDSLWNNTRYFHNSTHLNIHGAEIFSRNLANELSLFIKKNQMNELKGIVYKKENNKFYVK